MSKINDEQLSEMFLESQKVNEQRRAERLQVAIMALRILASPNSGVVRATPEGLANGAVILADALLKRLDETGKA